MIRKIAVFFAFLSMATAVDIAGKWNVDAQSSEGRQYKLELLLKDEGGNFSGTLTTEEGDVVALHDIKHEGDELTFKLYVDAGTYSVTLKVSDRSMKGAYKGPEGESGTVSATR